MRRYEYIDGTSAKFWSVSVSGAEMTTQWGRIGTPGQSKTRAFASARADGDLDAILFSELIFDITRMLAL